MLTRLARLSTQHARAVVIAAVVLFAVAGALGGGVADHLTSGGFEDPSSESERADEALADRFDTGVPNLLLLVTAEGGDVDDPAAAQAGQELADRLAGEEGVTDVVSYWSEGNAPPLRNDDGSRALVVARIEGNDDEVEDRVTELGPRYEQAAGAGNATAADAISVEVGGFAEVFHEVGDTIEEDLVRAETIALPITLVLLVIVFGSLVAASLPLVIGIMSIIGTFFVLRVLAAMTDVSIYALNLTTALGLGLAIDYSLFVVSRYREELRAGHEPRAAAVRTVRTAGRTVGFSALTVAASLCATLVFPIAFLRSFAYAGVAVALLAGVFSVVVLPAILVLLGHRVNALTLWRRSVTPPEQGIWHRVATLVMRRPIPIATAVIALLLVVGAPRPGAAGVVGRPPGARRDPRRVLVGGGRGPVGGRPRHRRRRRRRRRGRRRCLRRRAGLAARRVAGRRRHRHLLRHRRRRPARLRARPARPPARQLAPLRRLQRRRRHLPVGRALGRAHVRGRRRPRAHHPRRRQPVGCAGHRPVRRSGRYQRCALRPPALGARARRGDHRRAAVHDVRQRGHPGQGHRAQPAQPHGHVRRHGLDLPGWQPVGPARLHRHR